VIYENADENANIIFGALVDPSMDEEISITVLACDFKGMNGGLPVQEEERGPNFYKERRNLTRSPLGPDATVEETRMAITRGFKKPPKEEEESVRQDQGGLGGFFRRLVGKKN
jgi:cell division protein FtsZ